MNTISVSNEIFDSIKHNNSYESEMIINKTLIKLLLTNINNDLISLQSSERNKIEYFLQKSNNYLNNISDIDTLISERCEAWQLLDQSKGIFKILIGLIIYTMYDSKHEDFELDIYEYIANIVSDLIEIEPILINRFKQELQYYN